MYYFIQAYELEDAAFLRDTLGRPESSDISDIEGWVVEDGKLRELENSCHFVVYDIPERYQNDIDEFKTDYWDGEFTFEKKRWIEAN